MDLVSIITPVYNSEKYISETLDSVISQTYQNWEIILVDDASEDSSVRIINNYIQKDNRIKLIQLNQNYGSGIARNKAIEVAKGKYIAFLDSDDIWIKNKLELHVGYMQKMNCAFSHTSYGYIDENGNKIKNILRVSKEPVSYYDLLKRTEISCLTAMYDCKKLGKMYMPDLRRKQDYGLWLDILKKGEKSYPLDKVLAFYRQRKNSATRQKWKLISMHWNFLRDREKLSVIQTVCYTSIWMFRGLVRYYVK